MVSRDYLVRFGISRFLGRFRFAGEVAPSRGDAVRIRSRRGLESGEVLCELAPGTAHLISSEDFGELLSVVPAELALAQESRERADCDSLLGRAQSLARELGCGVVLIDLELLDDGSTGILHGIPGRDAVLDPLLERLHADTGCRFLWESPMATGDIEEPIEASSGCGKEGCGTEGGGGCGDCGTGESGCSTGGCSSGKVKSAKELTGFFRELRERLEADVARTPLETL